MKAGWILLVLAACDGGGGGAAAPDAAAPDVDAAPIDECAEPLTGSIVDMHDVPVVGAKLTYDATNSVVTDQYGNFSICPCVPVTGTPTVLALDAPADYLDGSIYFEYPTTYHPIVTMREGEAGDLFTLDPERAQVLVLEDADDVSVTLNAEHDPSMSAYEGQSWEAGSGGRYVLFPNVDVSAPIVPLQEDGSLDPTGPHYIDVAAGKISLVVIQSVLD